MAKRGAHTDADNGAASAADADREGVSGGVQGSPGARLRALWRQWAESRGEAEAAKRGIAATLAVPGVPDPLVARLAEQAGFSALYVSGAATSNQGLGLPDLGLATATEMAEWAGRIARTVAVPVIADADTGYGNALNAWRTVTLFERAGVAGIHLEDQTFPKRCGHVAGKRLIERAEMEGRIRAACRARADSGFVIIARTDARAVEGLDGAIERGVAYLEAGADAVFPEALESEEELATYAERLSGTVLVANCTEFGKTPIIPSRRFAELGYAMVLFPVSALRVMLGAAREFLRGLRESGTQKEFLQKMLTRAELYDLLEYQRFTEMEKAFLPEGGVAPLE